MSTAEGVNAIEDAGTGGVRQWVSTFTGEYDSDGDTNSSGEKKGKFLFLQKNIYINCLIWVKNGCVT